MTTANEPGKYDDLATHVRESTNASAVVVIVIGGDKGHGFSVQSVAGVLPPHALVEVLRATVDDIEKQAKQTKS